jgi:hypothetical protein
MLRSLGRSSICDGGNKQQLGEFYQKKTSGHRSLVGITLESKERAERDLEGDTPEN